MGKFWAIGVGPGDPGLLTLKAVEILRRVQVIYHPGPKPDRGRAWDIVHSYLRPDQEVRILLTESMASANISDGKTPYQSAVDRIATDCRAGKDVALVTEGDPTLYSTAANVWQLLQERHPDIPIEVVPGVSSITAAAARVGWPLPQKGYNEKCWTGRRGRRVGRVLEAHRWQWVRHAVGGPRRLGPPYSLCQAVGRRTGARGPRASDEKSLGGLATSRGDRWL